VLFCLAAAAVLLLLQLLQLLQTHAATESPAAAVPIVVENPVLRRAASVSAARQRRRYWATGKSAGGLYVWMPDVVMRPARARTSGHLPGPQTCAVCAASATGMSVSRRRRSASKKQGTTHTAKCRFGMS
jgi:hypothetical protein